MRVGGRAEAVSGQVGAGGWEGWADIKLQSGELEMVPIHIAGKYIHIE